MQNAPLEAWQGEFGNAYTERNAQLPLAPRVELWRQILWNEQGELRCNPSTVLEVGANIGQNLMALREITRPYMAAVEPNATAREVLILNEIPAYAGQAEQLDFPDGSFDLVFTSGVLIHISPNSDGQGYADHPGTYSPLQRACREITRVSKKWVLAIEYFSAQPREVTYRNHTGLLWTRDFGQFYMDECGLRPEAYGFAWKPLTGLDNVTWWLLRKA